MPVPPVTKKPIPKRVGPWLNELDGMIDYAERLDRLRAANGVKWVKSMRAHTDRRIADLIDNPPRRFKVPLAYKKIRKTIDL